MKVQSNKVKSICENNINNLQSDYIDIKYGRIQGSKSEQRPREGYLKMINVHPSWEI